MLAPAPGVPSFGLCVRVRPHQIPDDIGVVLYIIIALTIAPIVVGGLVGRDALV